MQQNAGNKEFAGSARSTRRNTSVLPASTKILSIGFAILILSVLVLQLMWKMTTMTFNILSKDNVSSLWTLS